MACMLLQFTDRRLLHDDDALNSVAKSGPLLILEFVIRFGICRGTGKVPQVKVPENCRPLGSPSSERSSSELESGLEILMFPVAFRLLPVCMLVFLRLACLSYGSTPGW